MLLRACAVGLRPPLGPRPQTQDRRFQFQVPVPVSVRCTMLEFEFGFLCAAMPCLQSASVASASSNPSPVACFARFARFRFPVARRCRCLLGWLWPLTLTLASCERGGAWSWLGVVVQARAVVGCTCPIGGGTWNVPRAIETPPPPTTTSDLSTSATNAKWLPRISTYNHHHEPRPRTTTMTLQYQPQYNSTMGGGTLPGPSPCPHPSLSY